MHLGELAQVGVVLDLLVQRLTALDRQLPPLGILPVPPPVFLHGTRFQISLGPGCC
jgi:hypothetical protein